MRLRYAPPLDPNPRFREPFRCELCDRTYSTIEEQDLVEHEQDHEQLQEMERWTGRLMSLPERRDIEHESARVLNSGAPLAERVTAAERLLWAHCHLHLRRVAKAGIAGQRCSVEDFIAAANLEGMFAADVAAELRRKHGRLDWPEISMREWVYRD